MKVQNSSTLILNVMSKIPFTTEQFLQVFEKYNQAIYPFQFVLTLVAIIVPIGFANAAVFLTASRKPFANKLISCSLGFFWLWTGIVYHLIFFTAISPPAYLFGTLFIIQGLLFFYEGVARNRLSFRPSRRFDGILGAVFIAYALVIYPSIGYVLGRIFPSTPTFGTPCPTTIFIFGLLLWADRKISLSLLIIPILWSIVGTSAALSFGVKEDFGLLVAATMGTAALAKPIGTIIVQHNSTLKTAQVL
jgi:hypothetical protein